MDPDQDQDAPLESPLPLFPPLLLKNVINLFVFLLYVMTLSFIYI